jgi:hypothetical protein
MAAENMRTTQNPTGRRTVIGVFDGPRHAEMALNGLRDAGFKPDQVSVVARESDELKQMIGSTGMGTGGAATATGAVVGGLTGGVLGWLVGIGALAIPGIGPVVAAGAFATALGGAAIGAAAGGLLGALIDMGVPEEDARSYETSVREGSILLSVNALSATEASKARSIFNQFGASNLRYYGADDVTWDDDDSSASIGGAAAGGATGAVLGGAAGTMVAGPIGTAAGAAIGGAAGAAAGHLAGGDDSSGVGAGAGGATGAVVGGAIGSVAGPVGTAAGAAIGGAAGGAAGSKADDVAEDVTDDDTLLANDPSRRSSRPGDPTYRDDTVGIDDKPHTSL